MGAAYDRDGNMLGEADGNTFKEVLEKLQLQHKEAWEIRLKKQIDDAEARLSQINLATTKESE